MATERPNRPRGDIGLGDLARVLRELELSDIRHLHLAGRSLGFEGLAHPDIGRTATAADNRVRRKRGYRQRPTASGGQFALPEPEVTPEPVGEILHTRLDPLPSSTLEAKPSWLDEPVDTPPATQVEAVRRAPLFQHNRAAGVLKAAIAVRRPGRRLNLPLLLDWVLAAKPLRELPRLPSAGLEHGVDLFCDYAESMQPFYSDLEQLTGSLSRLVGKNRCRVFEYETAPLSALDWSNDLPRQWAPLGRRPVLLATDFGRGNPLGRRLKPGDWWLFMKRLRESRTSVIACSPLPPATCPSWLGRDVKIIHWDPRTRAGTIRKLVGPGLGSKS